MFVPTEDATMSVFIMTGLTVLISYFFFWKFAKEMASIEYEQEVDYKDRYVARHSVIIRGVNR